jgi:hypothetical protein
MSTCVRVLDVPGECGVAKQPSCSRRAHTRPRYAHSGNAEASLARARAQQGGSCRVELERVPELSSFLEIYANPLSDAPGENPETESVWQLLFLSDSLGGKAAVQLSSLAGSPAAPASPPPSPSRFQRSALLSPLSPWLRRPLTRRSACALRLESSGARAQGLSKVTVALNTGSAAGAVRMARSDLLKPRRGAPSCPAVSCFVGRPLHWSNAFSCLHVCISQQQVSRGPPRGGGPGVLAKQLFSHHLLQQRLLNTRWVRPSCQSPLAFLLALYETVCASLCAHACEQSPCGERFQAICSARPPLRHLRGFAARASLGESAKVGKLCLRGVHICAEVREALVCGVR